MGDSYSTYGGYIPEGYLYYYGGERKDPPIIGDVEKTWWKRLSEEKDFNIVLNDSFSGSTVCNTLRPGLPFGSSFIRRMDKYISEGFFDKNKIDKMFIFGGTNDSWLDSPIGEVKYSDWTEDELKCVLPAFCYLLEKAKTVIEDIVVIINSELKDEITNGFITACRKNNIKCLLLSEIDKENGHPTELGMKQISEQVGAFIG